MSIGPACSPRRRKARLVSNPKSEIRARGNPKPMPKTRISSRSRQLANLSRSATRTAPSRSASFGFRASGFLRTSDSAFGFLTPRPCPLTMPKCLFHLRPAPLRGNCAAQPYEPLTKRLLVAFHCRRDTGLAGDLRPGSRHELNRTLRAGPAPVQRAAVRRPGRRPCQGHQSRPGRD